MDRELPHVALSAHAHNREGLHRTDDEWLAERWSDPSTLVLVVAGTRLRLRDGTPEWVAPTEVPLRPTECVPPGPVEQTPVSLEEVALLLRTVWVPSGTREGVGPHPFG